jgi:hypothetical protein
VGLVLNDIRFRQEDLEEPRGSRNPDSGHSLSDLDKFGKTVSTISMIAKTCICAVLMLERSWSVISMKPRPTRLRAGAARLIKIELE